MDPRIIIYGLIISCPIGHDENEDCPFFNIRRQPLGERIKLIKEMKIEGINFLVNEHQHCVLHCNF